MKNRISYLVALLLMLFSGVGAKAQTTCYVVNDAKEREWSTIDDSGNYNLSGPGKTLTFEAKRTAILGVTNTSKFYAKYSNDGNSWSNALTLSLSKKDTWYSFSVEIPTTAKYVRFETETGATGKKQIRNVKVTRATTLSSSTTSLDFGTLDGVGATSTKTINVAYNNTINPTNLTGSCTNGQFTVTGKSMGETGNADISIKYTPTSIGNHSGTVTLTMGSASYQFAVSGTFTGNRFNFSASAQSSNAAYGSASASVAEAEIHNLTTSASTTATFTATPASGCTFNGWYDNPGYTGNPVSTSATYQTTITNNTVNSTASKTLYAKFKKNQTISWNNSFDTYTVINGTTAANSATASSGLAVTYTSSNTDAIKVDADGTLHGVSLGKSTITVSQAGNSDYNMAESISREFSVIDKLQPSFTPSFSGTSTTMEVGQNATIALANVTDGFSFSSSTPGIMDLTRTGKTITLTALKEGSTTLTLNDPGNAVTNPVFANYTISVIKVENTLSVDMASLETTVGNNLAVTFTGRNNIETPIVGAISNQVLSSSVNIGSNVISYNDGVVTALNAGTATITFSQAATDKYTSATQKSFDIIVSKNSNAISVTIDGAQRNSINLGHNASKPFFYTSPSDASYSVTMTSGSESIASINGNNIATHSTDGTVIWIISQAETYKYEGASTSVRVKVNSTPEAEGYVLNDDSEYKHGTGSGVIHQYTLSGPGEVVQYSAKRTWSAIYYNLYVECSADGQRWETIQDNTSVPESDYSDFQCTIPENARYLRFRFPAGGTLTKYIKNVKVTRKTYVRASSDKTDLGNVKTGTIASATLTVDWSSTNGGNISIENSNPCFTANPASITGTANKDGKTAVTITFTPNPSNLGENKTTITVSDLFYTQEIALTATAEKQITSITKNYDDPAAASLKVDDDIANAFTFSGVSAATPSASSEADFYYVIDHHVSGNTAGSSHPDEVVAYDPATNKVTALNAGTATVTIHQKNTSLYAATNASFEFTVVKHDQTIAWDNEISELTLKKGQTLETNTATASSGLAVSYSSSNTLSIKVDSATGVMTAVEAGADVNIIATQEGNYKYNSASATRKFTVFSQSTPVFTPSFDGTKASLKVDETATIALENVSAGLDGDFTATMSTNGVISLERTDGILTITALDEGEVKLILTQKGNDDFLAKSMDYSITVTLPDDYIVLNPDAPVPAEGKYRKITLKRNIPAGMSTIALPFSTTLDALTYGTSNDGAKAYVLKNVGVDSQKGYVFYFKEVEGGILSAGVPYVICLESEVVMPVWRSDDGIQVETDAASINCGAWSITANFEGPKNMNGLYGVVNTSNNIMLGGPSAMLNSYAAYFTLRDSDTNQTKSSLTKAETDMSGLLPLFIIPVE